MPVALSSDNRTLLFTDRGDAAGTITAVYIRGTDGSPAVRLGEGVAKALSPDGRWALAGRGAASDRLVLLPVGVGQESILPTGSLVFNRFADWAAFHPDGKSVLFSAIEPGHRIRIYRVDLEGGSPKAVSAEGIRPLLISPDGTLVLARKDDDQMGLVPVDGASKPFRTVARLPQNVFPVHWAADGKSVLIGDFDVRPVRVDRLDLTTGERRTWRSFSAGGRMGSGGPDGLAITGTEDGWVAGYIRMFSQLIVVDGLK